MVSLKCISDLREFKEEVHRICNPANIEVRFLLVLEARDLVNLSTYQAAGFNDYILKPFHVDRLVTCLKKLIENLIAQSPIQRSLSISTLMDNYSPADDRFTSSVIKGMKVMVVEDNHVNQLVAEKMLKKLGCDVIIAKDGFEALRIYDSYKLDVIFMDLHMPNIDGFETTRRLREKEATNRAPRLPIVALTAKSMTTDRVNCLEANMDDYVSKPHSMNDLRQILIKYSPRSIDRRNSVT